LVFEKVIVILDVNISITILKKVENQLSEIKMKIEENGKKIYNDKYEINLDKIKVGILKSLALNQIEKDKWKDGFTNRIFSFKDLLSLYGENFSKKQIEDISTQYINNGSEIFNSLQVYIIQEQRLHKKIGDYGQSQEYGNQSIVIENIQIYSGELKNSIFNYSRKLYQLSQELDGSYPNRLINEKGSLSAEEYAYRFNEIKKKQYKLKENGLYNNNQEVIPYSEPDYKALLVYLKLF
jgi:hypothetical protein